MQGNRPKFILELIAGLTLFTTQSTAQPPRFTTIDVPNSVFLPSLLGSPQLMSRTPFSL